MVDINGYTADDPGLGFGMNVGRESKRIDICVILNELQLLQEQRRGLHELALGTHYVAAVNIEENAAFEQTRALLARLDLVDMHQAASQITCSLVGEFIVGCTNGVRCRVVFLHMVSFGLQHAKDDIGFYEIVSAETHGFE